MEAQGRRLSVQDSPRTEARLLVRDSATVAYDEEAPALAGELHF